MDLPLVQDSTKPASSTGLRANVCHHRKGTATKSIKVRKDINTANGTTHQDDS